MRRLAAVKHTRPGRQDRRVMSSEPVVELGGSFYLGERGVCGGGEPRGHETVPGKGGAYWSLCVPMGRARSGLPQEPLWGRQGPKK